MTELQRMYRELTDQGVRPHQAIRQLARRLDLDPYTIERVLDRADTRKD